MRPTDTRNATHNFQAPANWDAAKDGVCSDLPVRVQMSGGTGIFETVSTWKPTDEDIAHINRGGVIELFICLPPTKVFGESTPNQPVVGMAVVDPVSNGK